MSNFNISIRYKILISFIVITLLTIPISLYAISATNQIKEDFSNIVDFSFPRLHALLEMQMAARRISSFINNFNNEIEKMSINENTPTKIGATKDKMLAYLSEIEEWQNVYQDHISKNERSTLDLNKLTKLRDIVVLAALDSFAAKEKNLSKHTQEVSREKLEAAQYNLDHFIQFSIITESDILNQKKSDSLNATKKIFMVTLFLNTTIVVIAILISLVLTGLISRPIIRLKNFANSINQDNLDHRFSISTYDEIGELATSINNMLENLLQAKKQLIEASRSAGVAEVATSILHNVGNVLNSINISVAIMNERVNKSKSVEIQKINLLLNQHKKNLNEYINSDERGKLILPYMEILAKELKIENANLIAELNQLTTNLQHVNNVIAMQQIYGHSKGFAESIQMAELIEAICTINRNKLQQLDIKIVREFEDCPPITSVKAKLQQILINLLKNSIEALELSCNPNKIIIIKLIKLENNMKIYIIDNGIGIENKNLTKIFSFGFTTKQNGHGYGVHNSALLARELGGQLIATSDGIEKGTTFLLIIPY